MADGRRARRLVALMVGALSLATVFAAGPARAATAAPAADAQCHWNDYPNLGGTWLCKYGRHLWTLKSGTKVGFVIGLDYTVRFRSIDTKGKLGNWTSLGGQIIHSGGADSFTVNACTSAPNDDPIVWVVGTDGRKWNRTRLPDGSWAPWSTAAVICN